VNISGKIEVSGQTGGGFAGGVGGPGGGRGGSGGLAITGLTQGQPGDGPGGGFGGTYGGGSNWGYGGGGGYATPGLSAGGSPNGAGGSAYGGATLLPLLGGSGGGGTSSGGVGAFPGGGGGGGGGAILIASSGNITFVGEINANGGNGGIGGGSGPRGGGGSGGAIRLMTNTISGSGGFLRVLGGIFGGTSSLAGGSGFIRVEALNAGEFNPNLSTGAILSFALPGAVTLPATAPRLRIASVAGISAPTSPLGSLQGQPDIVVPSTQPNPVTVALEASNLPLGMVVDVTVTPERGTPATVQSTTLSGTEANSTATASVTLSNMISVISAKVVINLNPASAGKQMSMFIDGEPVERMEVAAVYGGASEVFYILRSGRRIKAPVQEGRMW
jgi:hypothetical protein